jgi:hypothetical protein
MRFSTKSVAITGATVVAAVLGAAGPAHASTVKCGFAPLRSDISGVEVISCGEADGIQRRGVTTVLNFSNQTVEIHSLRALLSFPSYSEQDCGHLQLAPGTKTTCTTPWVAVRFPQEANRTLTFSLVEATAQGQRVNHISNYAASF